MVRVTPLTPWPQPHLLVSPPPHPALPASLLPACCFLVGLPPSPETRTPTLRCQPHPTLWHSWCAFLFLSLPFPISALFSPGTTRPPRTSRPSWTQWS